MSGNSDAIGRAAALLIDAHRDFRQIAERPDSGPGNRDEAFATQDRVAAALGPVGGWKIGASGPYDETPTVAPLPAALISDSPAELPVSRFHGVAVEAELAFLIAKPLPSRAESYGRDEVLAAIGTLHVAIEIVESRLGSWGASEPLWKLADNQSNGFFVYGPPVLDWHGRDLAAAPAELVIDGTIVASAPHGGNAAGDPRWLLVWLANHCSARGCGLEAGQLVTTGSCTGMTPTGAGAHVTARFPGIGEAAIHFVP